MKVSSWKRQLSRLGFEGSINAWPEPFGNDLSVEAIPGPPSRAGEAGDGQLKPVQTIFKQDNDLPARVLLGEFSRCLVSVLAQCREQVEDARDVHAAQKAIQAGGFSSWEQVKQSLDI